jgi:hypothetical protein
MMRRSSIGFSKIRWGLFDAIVTSGCERADTLIL